MKQDASASGRPPASSAPEDAPWAWGVREGTRRDWEHLARFHYRAARPATIVRVLRIGPDSPEPAGVLVVSMPTLNGEWRDHAWPGRYRAGPDLSKRDAAARLNAEVRTISRVVVDPRWRGLGLARRLVAAYLGDPLTPATEAAAAMGACCPFFARAGMREYRVGPTRAAARLGDALWHVGLGPADLACWPSGRRAPAFLERELRAWARESRATRARADAPLAELMGAGAAALLAPRVAYAAGGIGVKRHRGEPGEPARPADLPRPLTIFLSAAERARVVAALRAIETDRRVALLRVLGLDRSGDRSCGDGA